MMHTDQDMQRELDDIGVRMLKEYRNYFLLRSEILKVLLKIFMIYLTRKMEPAQYHYHFGKEVEMLRKFMDLLKKHCATKKLVSDYADELCVTPNYLNSIIKKISGYPASHHIRQYIVLEAKRQALYSGLRMKEIAYFLVLKTMLTLASFLKLLRDEFYKF